MLLTIKELTRTVGGKVTPRMVRHYHQLGLLPQPQRSSGNYRLYSEQDVQRLQRVVTLKQQGFQLSHIHKLLEGEPDSEQVTLLAQLQQQYRSVIQQISQLRQTASALEGLLGRDRHCQVIQSEALAQLKSLEAKTQAELETLWRGLDAAIDDHSEAFNESLQKLLPDLSDRSEIEVDLLSKLVLACGDVSLVPFVQLSRGAIAAAREGLKTSCTIVTDVTTVTAALDQTRLAHLGCSIETLINDPHINDVAEAEQAFRDQPSWQQRLQHLPSGCILVVGYAPSVLLAVCAAIQARSLSPALVIGMPIGFSHAPAAKRRLAQLEVPSITIAGTIGGGLLAAAALNSLVESLIEKPECHCYLTR